MSCTGSSCNCGERADSDALAREAENCLEDHLREQARTARALYGGLSVANRDGLLRDTRVLRYPVRVTFGSAGREAHQFAQPLPDPAQPGHAFLFNLHPVLERDPELALLAVAYTIPLVNYGEVVEDRHCIAYGAELLGLDDDTFAGRVAAMADRIGLEPRYLQD